MLNCSAAKKKNLIPHYDTLTVITIQFDIIARQMIRDHNYDGNHGAVDKKRAFYQIHLQGGISIKFGH